MATAKQAERTAREALMHAYLEAWNLHDPDAVAAFFPPPRSMTIAAPAPSLAA